MLTNIAMKHLDQPELVVTTNVSLLKSLRFLITIIKARKPYGRVPPIAATGFWSDPGRMLADALTTPPSANPGSPTFMDQYSGPLGVIRRLMLEHPSWSPRGGMNPNAIPQQYLEAANQWAVASESLRLGNVLDYPNRPLTEHPLFVGAVAVLAGQAANVPLNGIDPNMWTPVHVEGAPEAVNGMKVIHRAYANLLLLLSFDRLIASGWLTKHEPAKDGEDRNSKPVYEGLLRLATVYHVLYSQLPALAARQAARLVRHPKLEPAVSRELGDMFGVTDKLYKAADALLAMPMHPLTLMLERMTLPQRRATPFAAASDVIPLDEGLMPVRDGETKWTSVVTLASHRLAPALTAFTRMRHELMSETVWGEAMTHLGFQVQGGTPAALHMWGDEERHVHVDGLSTDQPVTDVLDFVLCQVMPVDKDETARPKPWLREFSLLEYAPAATAAELLSLDRAQVFDPKIWLEPDMPELEIDFTQDRLSPLMIRPMVEWQGEPSVRMSNTLVDVANAMGTGPEELAAAVRSSQESWSHLFRVQGTGVNQTVTPVTSVRRAFFSDRTRRRWLRSVDLDLYAGPTVMVPLFEARTVGGAVATGTTPNSLPVMHKVRFRYAADLDVPVAVYPIEAPVSTFMRTLGLHDGT